MIREAVGRPATSSPVGTPTDLYTLAWWSKRRVVVLAATGNEPRCIAVDRMISLD